MSEPELKEFDILYTLVIHGVKTVKAYDVADVQPDFTQDVEDDIKAYLGDAHLNSVVGSVFEHNAKNYALDAKHINDLNKQGHEVFTHSRTRPKSSQPETDSKQD